MRELESQTVAVVGASSGIGLAAAQAAARRGARAILLGRSRSRLDEAAKTVEGGADSVAVDMLDEVAVAAAVGSIGALDHLVLTAVGDEYALFGAVTDLRIEQIERSFDKLRGYVNVTRAAAPRLRERGSITFISGAGAMKPPKGTSLAAAANAAVAAFARALSIELAPLRVNAVMPGVVDTPLHGARREALAAWAESALPARRFGQPADVADAIVFLMTNPYVTGHTLVVDGGLLAT